MAFVEYVLLVLLGSAAAVPGSAPGNSSVTTIGADSIAQPAGGAMSSRVPNTNSSDKKGQKRGKKHYKETKKPKKKK